MSNVEFARIRAMHANFNVLNINIYCHFSLCGRVGSFNKWGTEGWVNVCLLWTREWHSVFGWYKSIGVSDQEQSIDFNRFQMRCIKELIPKIGKICELEGLGFKSL